MLFKDAVAQEDTTPQLHLIASTKISLIKSWVINLLRVHGFDSMTEALDYMSNNLPLASLTTARESDCLRQCAERNRISFLENETALPRRIGGQPPRGRLSSNGGTAFQFPNGSRLHCRDSQNLEAERTAYTEPHEQEDVWALVKWRSL